MQFVTSADAFGQLVRRRRRELGMSQVQLAQSTKTGERFIVELEQGKATCQLGKALQVAQSLGICLADHADQPRATETPRISARQAEAEMLKRCVAAARGETTPVDQREANIFQVASSLLSGPFPRASMALRTAAHRYFEGRSNERLTVEEVVRRGWVPSLPRLRDSLTVQLVKLNQSREE